MRTDKDDVLNIRFYRKIYLIINLLSANGTTFNGNDMGTEKKSNLNNIETIDEIRTMNVNREDGFAKTNLGYIEEDTELTDYHGKGQGRLEDLPGEEIDKTKAPDGGWGWIIVFGVMMIRTIVGKVIFSHHINRGY